MKVLHFYHVYAGGAWQVPAAEHTAALAASGFCGGVTVGLAGPPGERAAARAALGPRLGTLSYPRLEWAERGAGFEQVTLAALRDCLASFRGEAAVLYAHTKGAHDQTAWNAVWRRSMTRHVVSGWRHCAEILASGYDTVGCHWLTPDKYHSPPYSVDSPFYGGNFWWARASYLRTLPPPGHRRHDAEKWIGLGEPKAYDLLPGWPHMRLCA